MSFVSYSLAKEKLTFAKPLALSSMDAYASGKAAALDMTCRSPSPMTRFSVSETEEANFVLPHVCTEAQQQAESLMPERGYQSVYLPLIHMIKLHYIIGLISLDCLIANSLPIRPELCLPPFWSPHLLSSCFKSTSIKSALENSEWC